MIELDTVGQHYTPRQRFWTWVEKKSKRQCWPWIGTLNGCGYGSFGINRGTYLAHRVSWLVNRGPIPEGMCVLHHCDNPPCVNPAHLYIGTMADNCADRERRGRGGDHKGEKHGRAKLTWKKVREIRATKNPTLATLSKRFNVSEGAIWFILKGLTWKDLPN